MKFRSLDKNGDWNFGQGKASYATDIYAICLNIKTRLLSWKYDCFFDYEAGIDWKNRLGDKNQFFLLKSDVAVTIMQTDGVNNLLSFEANLKDRTFESYFYIDTVYGKINNNFTQEVGI